MRSERPGQLDRLVTTSEAVAALNALFAAEEPLDEALMRVARTAARAIPDADAVSITVLAQPKPRTAAYTDERILRLDLEQYASNRGPCLEAAEMRRAVRVSMDTEHQRWPEFIVASQDEGVHATLSVPLIVPRTEPEGEGELVGSLNIYSRSITAFDPFDEELMRLYTVAASQTITNARRWQKSRHAVAQLERALISRADIDQAKGVIRALNGCTADEAFAKLVEKSQQQNIKLQTIAEQLLDSLSERRDD